MKMLKTLIHTLRFQMLAPVAVVITVIVVLLSMVASRLYTETLLSKEAEKTMASFDLISTSVSTTIEASVSAATNLCLLNGSVQEYMNNNFTRLVNRVLCRIQLRTQLQQFLYQQPNLHGVAFFRSDGSMFGQLGEHGLYFDTPIITPSNIDSHLGNTQGIVYTNLDHMLENKQWIPLVFNPESTAVIIRRIIIPQGAATAYVAVLLRQDSTLQYLRLLSDRDSTAGLLLPDGTSLISTDGKEVLSKTAWQILQENEATSHHWFSCHDDTGNYYLCWNRIPGIGWYLVRRISTQSYEMTARNMRLIIWLVAGGLMIASMLIYLLWIKRFVRSFNILKDGIIRTGGGNLWEPIHKPFSIIELDTLRNSFNDMNRSLDELIRSKQRIEREQVEAEIRNLQMQLSPHMIFNSVTAIRWMALMMGDNKTAEMLAELTGMLRPVFREWTLTWTLRQELEHLKHYGRLLDLRFGNQFRMSCDVPEELMDTVIPRFTIQPLVENACEHSVVPQDGCLCVEIKAESSEDTITLTVSNNGESMTDEKLREVQEILHSGSDKSKVGLHNVYARLCMCLGPKSEMNVSNLPGGGVKVTLIWEKQTIPPNDMLQKTGDDQK